MFIMALLMVAGTASAATLTAHVSGCGGIASDDSLLDTLPDGTTYYSPVDKYVSLKKGWLRTDTEGHVTWDGPVQTKTWNLYYAVKVLSPEAFCRATRLRSLWCPVSDHPAPARFSYPPLSWPASSIYNNLK